MDGARQPGDGRETSEWGSEQDAGGAGTPHRRRFLAMAGLAAGAVPLAGTLGAGLVAPAISRRYAGRAEPQAAPGVADWAALRRALSTHKLIRPGGKMYPAAKELFDPRFELERGRGRGRVRPAA